MNNSMSRRPRKPAGSGGSESSSATHSHNRSESPTSCISACILFIAMVLFFGYLFGSSVIHHSKSGADSLARKLKPVLSIHSFQKLPSRNEESQNSTPGVSVEKTKNHLQSELQDVLPLLKETYGKLMRRVLLIGPGSCDVVARLLRDDETQAWGIEPSDLENPSPLCSGLVRKGLIRVADVHRSLPYRSNTFSLVLVSNTLEHLTSRQLNKTLPELGRLTSHALVAFISGSSDSGMSRQLLAGIKPVKHHNRTWWSHRFENVGLEEDEQVASRFETLRLEKSLAISDYVFHLLPRKFE